MWPSSNMFLKKLITNLCLFPSRSSTSSSSTFTTTNNKNKPPSFSTHLSRHFSTQPVHNDHHYHPTEDEDPAVLDSTQNEKKQADKKKKKKMMIKRNLNALDASTSKSTTPDDDDDDEDVFFTSSSNHSDDHLISDHNYHHIQQPDFATAFASQRFFFSSPGESKSLIHHQSTSSQQENIKTSNSGPRLLSAGAVPVPIYSPDPYWDFRKSMQEMVEARSKEYKAEEEDDAAENLEYLHQLLTCYLTLNPISTHECIINAFSDLLVTFLFDKQAAKDHNATTGSARRSNGRSRPVSRRPL